MGLQTQDEQHPFDGQNDSSTRRTDNQRAVIWLGQTSHLLDAAWTLADVIHVGDSRALLRALRHDLADCVVIDTALPGYDLAALVTAILRHRPHTHILALVDSSDGEATDTPVAVQTLSRQAGADALADALDTLFAGRPQDHADPATGDADGPPPEQVKLLQDRMRHLEGLLQATFSLTGLVEADQILSDLRSVARVAVDADDMAVLLTDPVCTELNDSLKLGVPADYLEVCREQFHALDPADRPMYVGDEVLLRERLPDMLPSAARVREAEAAGAWSYMRVPLTIDHQLVGFVALFSHTPNRFNGAHLQLARLFTTQVATAVRNMRLSMRLSQAEQRQQAVAEVARLIAENLALDAVLARIVEDAVQLVDGIQGVVLLRQPDNSLLVSAISHEAPFPVGQRLPPNSGQAGQVARSGQPSVITNYRESEHAIDSQRDNFPAGAVLFGVPLIYRGRVLGVLQVIRRHTTPDQDQETVDVLMMLAPQAAIAIAKAQLHETVSQERRQLRAILQHTPAAVMVVDAAGYIRLFNPECERIMQRLELDPAAIREKSLPGILAELLPDQSPELGDLLDAIESGHILEIYLGPAGEYLVQIAPITGPDGNIEHYVGVGQDVTELRRMDRLKANLTRVLTHDLGGMLMLVRSPIELLEEPDIPPDQRESLRAMLIGSLDRMSNLIEDVRDLEMASSLGSEAMTAYEWGEVLDEVRKRHTKLATEQGITLEFETHTLPPDPLEGHKFLIVQAVDNLVSNAVKYTPEGGTVRVVTTVKDGCVIVRVEDNGLGIPADKLELVFDPFYRIKTPDRIHIPGTGLGLSLVRTIAEGHGGRVSVQSTLGEGSIFTLEVPLERDETEQDPASQVTLVDLTGATRPDTPPAEE